MNIAHRRHELLCRWIGDGVIVRGVGDKTQITTVENHERTLAGSAVDSVVMCELCERQPVGPVILSIVNEDPKILFDLLVNSFGLAIRLRMPGGRCIRGDVEESVEFFHELGDKLRSSI